MTVKRPNTYLHATWIAKCLVGEKSCLWSYWYKANNQGYVKAPSDFDSARWMMEHTELLNDLVEQLERQGCEVHIEHQNGFWLKSPRSGVVISGTPDIIAVHPDGRAVIYDVKTGQPSASHTAQLQIYMYLVPRVPRSRWKSRSFDGEVVYRDGSKVEVPAASVNAEFIQKVTAFVKKMVSPLPARKVPSERECGWCDIGKADCPERMEPEESAA